MQVNPFLQPALFTAARILTTLFQPVTPQELIEHYWGPSNTTLTLLQTSESELRIL